MKRLALLLSFVFVAGVAVAQENKPAATPAKAPGAKVEAQKPAEMPMAAKTHDVAAEIVSVDTVKNTVTVKGEKENATFPVEGKAIALLTTTKAGEKVTLTCKDDDKGVHKAVVGIKHAAKAPAKAPEPK